MNQLFRGRPLLAASLLACCPCFAAIARADLERARSAFAEWAEIKSQVGQERSEWTSEKALLADTLETARAEMEALDKRIEEITSSSSEADSKRAELNAGIEEAKAASEKVSAMLAEAEGSVRGILPLLPAPLQAELQPLISRIPKEGEPTKIPVSQRLQTIAAVLSQVEKFSSNLTLFSEIRALDGGESREVKTIYFGLGAAFFADASGSTAGYGSPGESGWEWKPAEGGMAAQIAQAIAVHENTAPPAFVSLPIELR